MIDATSPGRIVAYSLPALARWVIKVLLSKAIATHSSWLPWLLLAPPGSSLLLLALPGLSWLLLAPLGSSRLLLAPPGSFWFLLASPG